MALNKQRLSEGERQRLEPFPRGTAPCYCAGCAYICESSVDLYVPISDIMRCAMYAHGYGSRDMALNRFNTLPAGAGDIVFKADYSRAERACPQKIQIGRVLKSVCEELR